VFSIDTSSFIKRLDSLQVGDITYKDVQIRVFDSNTYYYVKRIGLIKKIITDSTHNKTTWSLIRSKIILPSKK
jgi:hypothetical protein